MPYNAWQDQVAGVAVGFAVVAAAAGLAFGPSETSGALLSLLGKALAVGAVLLICLAICARLAWRLKRRRTGSLPFGEEMYDSHGGLPGSEREVARMSHEGR